MAEYLPPVVTRLAMNLGDFEAKIEEAKSLIDSLHSTTTANIKVDTSAALAKVASLRKLASMPVSMPITANVSAVRSAATRAATGAASGGSNNNATIFGWQPYGIWGLVANIAKADIPLFNNALNQAYNAIRNTDSGLPTFISHLFSMSQGWHLVAEAVIETAAVWVPAGLAFGAFGVAALPTVKELYNQLLNMNTASTATGKSFQSLANAGQSLSQAVKPSVLEAFGEGLYTLQRDSGQLDAPLQQLGRDIDQIVARASVALGGNGSFWQGAVQDANLLMQAIGNLLGVLGSLARAVPGYAAILLQFGTNVLGVAEKVTGALEPVLAIFLKLHGAIFYGGLFGTAVAQGFGLLVSWAGKANYALLGLAARMEFLEDDGAVVKGITAVGTAMETLGGAGVLAGLGLVAGAIAAVVMYLKSGDSAAKSFGADLQQSISNSSISNLANTLATAQAEANAKVTASVQAMEAAERALNLPVSANIANAERMGSAARGAGAALYRAAEAAGTYKAAQQQVARQSANVNANVNAVAKALGVNYTQALDILNGAQVTSNQLTGKGANNLAQMVVEAEGYQAQLRVMTAGTGQLNNALNALNVTSSAQYNDIQKVTQAYSTWIGIVTGGDSAFTTFEQGQQTLITDLKSGGETVHTTLGKIADKYTTVKSSLNGTSQSALAARQAFDSQVSAAVSLYNNLDTMAAVSGSSAVAQHALAQAGKDVVAQLLPLAKGSSEATNQVYALAQIVGYTGNQSFAGLAKWAGKTKGAEGDLDKQQQILTETTADLTNAAKNLASGLQGAVTQAMVNAIANTSKLNGSTQNLANAFSKSKGKITSTVNQMAQNYIKSLKSMGLSDQQIEGSLGALAGSYGMNSDAAQRWANQSVAAADAVKGALAGIHSKTVTVTVLSNMITSPASSAPRLGVSTKAAVARGYASGTSGAASGWAWVGEAGPELVKFSGGERVIPSHVARGYAGGTGDGYVIENHVYLDGRKVYQGMQERAVTTQRRTGSNGLSKRTR